MAGINDLSGAFPTLIYDPYSIRALRGWPNESRELRQEEHIQHQPISGPGAALHFHMDIPAGTEHDPTGFQTGPLQQ